MRNKASFVGVLVASALALSACGGTSGESPAPTGGTTTPEQVAAAQARVQQARDVAALDYPIPADPVTPGTKRISVISGGENSPLARLFAHSALDAVAAAGWEATPLTDAQIDPKKMAGFIEQAVSQRVDGIIIASLDPNAMKSAIDAAAVAGIPIACISCSDHGFEGKLIAINNSLQEQAEVIGASVIARTDGKAKVMNFPDKGFPTVITRFELLDAYLAENCPGCEVETGELSISNVFKPGPPEFTAAMTAHPSGSLTDVIAPYGTAAVAMAKSAQQSGRTEISINAVDTTSDTLQQTAAGQLPLGATPVGALELMSWFSVDLLARQFAGAPLYDAENLPVALATEDNAQQFLPTGAVTPSGDFKATFRQLWGR